MKTHHWLLLLSLGVSACVSAGGVTEPRPEPPLENADQWQGVDCIAQYKKLFATSRPEAQKQYIECEAAQLPPLDPNRREYFGERYSPSKYLACRRDSKFNDTACDIYKLRRAENPEYWPYPDVPKPKWPEAPKESVYKPGMSSKDYFEALCKAEAGEFIYKTVENVEGIYQIRPRSKAEYYDYPQQDRYVLEDPYGYTLDEATSTGLHFRFFESTIPNRAADKQMFVRHEGKNQVEVDHIKSRYGYTWRGIARPHDRELGIAGGELMVVDLHTGEVIALHRGFARSGYVRNIPSGFFWLSALRCPSYKTWNYTTSILLNVLKPINTR